MNCNDVSLEEYLKFTSDEQDNFYKQILMNNKAVTHNSDCSYTRKNRKRKSSTMKAFGDHQATGRLMFVDELKRKDIQNNKVYYLCLCDCGTWYICRSDAFNKKSTNGGCFSCGCLNKEGYTKTFNDEKLQEKRIKNLKNYLSDKGLQIGDYVNGWIITQMEIRQEESSHTRKYVKGICPYCKLESHWIRADGIQSGSVISCGCASESRGEKKIRELLEVANIPFIKEATFNDCLSKKGQNLRFDFYVNYSYLIEFDGKQHFEKGSNWYKGESEFKELQERDQIKNQWSLSHKIPLIRIPYTHLNQLQLEDIQPNTSRFVLKED